MAFTTVVDRAVGYAPVEADWDTYIKNNMNSGVWVQLANSTLTVDTASIDFTSISGSWAHLMLEVYARATTVASSVNLRLRINNNSAANYDFQVLYGQLATAVAAEAFADASVLLGVIPANTAPANLFSVSTTMIPHYANSANNKVVIDANASKLGTSSGNMVIRNTAGFWRSNAAITRLTILPASGNLAAGSRATLYGLP